MKKKESLPKCDDNALWKRIPHNSENIAEENDNKDPISRAKTNGTRHFPLWYMCKRVAYWWVYVSIRLYLFSDSAVDAVSHIFS